jgi:hypothetical protein
MPKDKKRIVRKRPTSRKERINKRLAAIKTANGKMIAEMMIEAGIKGDYKDYILLIGERIVEYRRGFTVIFEEGVEPISGVRLVHKKDLHRIIGDDAHKLWHPTCGRLVDLPPAIQGKKNV